MWTPYSVAARVDFYCMRVSSGDFSPKNKMDPDQARQNTGFLLDPNRSLPSDGISYISQYFLKKVKFKKNERNALIKYIMQMLRVHTYAG